MKQEQPDVLSARNLGEYAAYEVPDDLDLWPSVKALVEAAERRPAPSPPQRSIHILTGWGLQLLRRPRLMAISATVLVIAVAAVSYGLYQNIGAAGHLELVSTTLRAREEMPLAGVYVHSDYAYVGGMSTGYAGDDIKVGIRIVDLSNPLNPELVARIPLRSREVFQTYDPASHGDAVVTHIDGDAFGGSSFTGDVAIVVHGVPEAYTPDTFPHPFGIWDVTDPTNPEFLSAVNLGTSVAIGAGLGDKPLDSKAVAGHYFVATYNQGPKSFNEDYAFEEDHVAVVDIADPRQPVVVGDWQPSGQAALFGLSLNEQGTRAYVTGIAPRVDVEEEGILYILDLSDPADPVEIGRYVWPTEGGPKGGPPEARRYTPYAVPNGDETLVILADGRWAEFGQELDWIGCGGHGRLHVLDISDLSQIRELSTFKIAESDTCWERPESATSGIYQATDMAVSGDLVYSTWLNGGLRVVDISDPSNPVEVAEFRSPAEEYPQEMPYAALSDVALYGDYALTTTVWEARMHILRLE